MSDHTKELPKGYHAISSEDKLKIQAFGQELTSFINKYANDHAEAGRFPYRIVLGGFDYHAQVVQELASAAMEDLMVIQSLAAEVGDRITEPFSPDPVVAPATPAETASISPADAVAATAPMEPSVEAPVAAATPKNSLMAAPVAPAEASVDPAPVEVPHETDTAAPAVEAPADGSFDPTLVS